MVAERFGSAVLGNLLWRAQGFCAWDSGMKVNSWLAGADWGQLGLWSLAQIRSTLYAPKEAKDSEIQGSSCWEVWRLGPI